jgi:hypothetical protein
MDNDKRVADLLVSCHDCGCPWHSDEHWELNSEPRVYIASGFIKRVCTACYQRNGQSLPERRRAAGLDP